MRRFEESQKSDFERSVKIGENNAECLREMRRWCKHVEIERVSEGLYAQMTGLPIATHSIGCPQVSGSSQSMNLRWIFSDFLLKHCAECSYHDPNGDTSWGDKIITRHLEEVKKREQAAKNEEDRILKLRSELRSKLKDISSKTEPESRSILEFIEAVFSENEAECKEASELLKQSVRLGPDLFPDAAIDLIFVLAGSDEFSEMILPVCVELANNRADLGARLSQLAFENIEKGLHLELSSSIIDALGEIVEYPLSEKHIERLLLTQNHYHHMGGWAIGQPDYSHSTTIIVRSFDVEPESVQNIIRRELQNKRDYVRFQLCGAIKLIQCERPQIAVNLLKELIQSLELYEEEPLSGVKPSGLIIHILQSAFRHSPKSIDQFIAESMVQVRPTIQEDIISVYRDQFYNRTVSWKERRELRNRVEVSEPENISIQRLLSWVKDEKLEIDIRTHALEALEMACKYATAGMVGYFDSFLGYFAIVSTQECPPNSPPKILLPDQQQDPQLEQLNEFNRTQQWRIFKQSLQKCLEELCEARPSKFFDSVNGCLNQPLENLEDEFKACCIYLLGEIGKNYLLRPCVLPLIWRGLMDYSSDWMRAKATHATIEMFSNSNTSPPANLVEIIILYLRDPKIVVHQAALRAVTWRPRWFDERQSIEILKCLSAHLHAYRDDKYQLDDICEAILTICPQGERLNLYALRMVDSIFPTGEELVDSKIAEKLIWFCEPTERVAQLVAKDIGIYLGRYDRDRLNSYEHSRRGNMLAWLHELPVETFQQTTEDLLTSAKEVANRDGWESCHFASLFGHFRFFQYEQEILETAASALPDEPRNEMFRASLRKLAMIASGNELLHAGNAEAAESCFEAGKD